MEVLAQAFPDVPWLGKRGVGRWDKSLRVDVKSNDRASVNYAKTQAVLVKVEVAGVRWRAVAG